MERRALPPLFLLLALGTIQNARAFYTNQSADTVLGQPGFTTGLSNRGNASPDSNTFNFPFNISTATGGRFFVADRSNHRVLIYNSVPTGVGTATADLVLGQSNFTSNNSGTSATALKNPHAVFYDGTRLYVADSGNNRVLIWNSLPTSNGQAADVVVGQPDFDTGTANTGGVAANRLNFPNEVFVASTSLSSTTFFISDASNHRVLIFKAIPDDSTDMADIVLGQSNFTNASANQGGAANNNTLNLPNGLYSDGQRLLISDYDNNRVLVFNAVPSTHNVGADKVIGQTGFTTGSANQDGGAANANTLSQPVDILVTNDRLFVSERNHRVLIFDNFSQLASANASASVVLGQSNMAGTSANPGGAISANRFGNELSHIALAGGRLYVADSSNHRVLAFEDTFGVYSVSPSSALIGDLVSLTITGDDFLSGSVVRLTKSGETPVTATNVSVASKTITATLDLTNQPAGVWNVVVSSGSKSFTVADGFTILAFSVSEVIPNFGYKNSSLTVVVKGSRFVQNAVLKLRKSGQPDVTATSVSLSSNTQLQGTFNLADKALGLWDVVVSSGPNEGALASSFLVTRLPRFTINPEASATLGSGGGTILIAVSPNGLAGTKLIVPSGAIPANISLDISVGGVQDPPELPDGFVFVKTPVDLSPSGMQFDADFNLEIPYSDDDLDELGIQDASTLRAHAYDEETGRWTALTPSVDAANKKATLASDHFSFYALTAPVPSDLASVDYFPNPFRPSQGHTQVRFIQLPRDTTVRIFTLAGELVRTLSDQSTGAAAWDGLNEDGKTVVSGVYLIRFDSSDGHSLRKLAVER